MKATFLWAKPPQPTSMIVGKRALLKQSGFWVDNHFGSMLYVYLILNIYIDLYLYIYIYLSIYPYIDVSMYIYIYIEQMHTSISFFS